MHGRSVTSMAAYEGQSGSKDRGDPEVRNPQHDREALDIKLVL